MRKLIVGLAGFAVAAGMASAQLQWIGDSAVYHVEGGTWYNAGANWAPTAFQGTDFGTVGSLTLGAEAATWDQGAGTVTEMGVNVNPLGDTGAAIFEGWLDLPYLSSTAANDVWQNTTGTEVASDKPAGTHTVSVFFRATRDGGSSYVWDSNGGANYTASFTVVPEPSTMALLGLGVGGLLVAIRRRK